MGTTRKAKSAAAFRYSPLVAALACAFATLDAGATTYPVTNNADGGAGSLRDALIQANAACSGSDDITFSGPFVISPDRKSVV